MIIVEGPDGAGKTTLVEAIIRHWHGIPPSNYHARIIHSPGPLDSGLYQWGTRHLNESPPVTIFDRFPYFSESIYGTVLRGHPLMTAGEFISLRTQLMEKEPLLIYCRPPFSVLQETSRVTEQMEGVLENLPEIVKRYDDAFAHWIRDFRACHYNFEASESVTLVLNIVQTYVRERPGRGDWL